MIFYDKLQIELEDRVQKICEETVTGGLISDNGTSFNDLFAMNLHYEDGVTGLGGGGQFNGNISALEWKGRDCQRRGYAFIYDDLNRLKNASYKAGENWTKEIGRYDEHIGKYDLQGNIEGLTRNGWVKTINEEPLYGTVDQLTYHYNGNRVVAVNDASLDATPDQHRLDFQDNGSKDVSGEYQYEGGNMIVDKNKDMTLKYNHLNLPTRISSSKATIFITYDALGRKLQKRVCKEGIQTQPTNPENTVAIMTQSTDHMVQISSGKGVPTVTINAPNTGTIGNITEEEQEEPMGIVCHEYDYLGTVELKDGELDAIYHDEGRITKNEDNEYQYEYTLTDHLGNGRFYFTVNEEGDDLQVLQENHYYPFGLTISDLSSSTDNRVNKYQYNSKELQSEGNIGLLDYGARYYDPQVARWWSVDPLAEKYANWSPYNYVLNNPLIHIDPNGLWVAKFSEVDGRIQIVAEQGDNLQSLNTYLNGFMSELQIQQEFYTQLDKFINFDDVENTIEGFYITLPENNYSRSLKNYDETYEQYNKKSYNCHCAAILGTRGQEFDGLPYGGTAAQMSIVDRNEILQEEYNLTGLSGATFGKTVITFGDKHSAVYFGTSKNGTIYAYQKYNWFIGPSIVPINEIAEDYGLPTGVYNIRSDIEPKHIENELD